MAYDPQNTYNKFNSKGCTCEDKEHCTCGHKDHKGCGCEDGDKCGCCPAGLVSVVDNEGKNIGCLTPNDAELYMKNTYRCSDGYIRVIDAGTGAFIGCLTAADFAVYKTALG